METWAFKSGSVDEPEGELVVTAHTGDDGAEWIDIVEHRIVPADPDRGGSELSDMGCIVCADSDIELVFIHSQVSGRRVAIPNRSSLCSACAALIKTGEFERAADRAEPLWDDFDRSDLLDTLRDIAVSIAR